LDNNLNGQFVYLSWKRGSKKTNKGETQAVKVTERLAFFNYTIQMECTLVQHEKTQKFDDKLIEFALHDKNVKYIYLFFVIL
jgi:hypothetical protein